MEKKFTGSGLIFPIEIGAEGRPDIISGTPLINASINHILSWPVRNKYFNEEFGSRLEELLEEPNDVVLRTLIRRFVIEALEQWEKRIELISVEIIPSGEARLDIHIIYQIRNTKIEETFIYPFYREIIY